MTSPANESHTTVRKDGGLMMVPGQGTRRNIINPSESHPARKGLRYQLTHRLLGRLERLAKARFYIRELTDEDVTKWPRTDELLRIIVQSVNASSEIEGEHIQAENVQLVLTPPSDIGEEHLNQDEKRRLETYKSISEACLWALQSDTKTILSYEFVIELHNRMFFKTEPNIAGKLKGRPVFIRGAGYDIETLPVEKTEIFLRALCDRYSKNFAIARDFAEGSAFLGTAEFLCDFLAIHPFSDGNGRTARILSTYLLERAGYHFARFYPLEQIMLETRDEYYNALFNAQRHWYQPDEDLSPWIDYFTLSVFAQWERAHQKVRGQARREHWR